MRDDSRHSSFCVFPWSTGRTFALLALTACSTPVEVAPAAAAAPQPAAVMPGPASPRRGGDAVARNDDCVACHSDIAEEWQASLHREAYTGREFQHSLQREPLPFCRGCHAPEADNRRPEPALAAIGVACVTCHLPAGDVVLSARPADAPLTADHPVLRTAAFASPQACGGCHEFTFPDRRAAPEFMQTTLREHAASQHSDRSCADCHMPRAADGHRSHRFSATRDEPWMRSVISVQAARPTPDRIELTLDLREDLVGHAFPTGDLMRRLSVQVEPQRPGRPRPQQQFLTRHWTTARIGNKGPAVRTESHDDRLGVGEDPRVLTFQLDPADATLPIRWRVDYERVESFIGPSDASAIVVGGIPLANGTLPPHSPP